MAKRIKVGDVVQIATSKGISYAQVTHRHPRYGHLLRVFESVYNSQPDNLAEVVATHVLLSAFFPIQNAVGEGLLTIVGNSKVTDANLAFPIFRGSARDKAGNRGPWWLWDGETEVMLTRGLSDDEKRYPVRGIISLPSMIERIEKGYRAETHDL